MAVCWKRSPSKQGQQCDNASAARRAPRRSHWAVCKLEYEEADLNIDIISDVVCPWCYIGKRQIEAALALYAQQHPGATGRASAGGRFSSIRSCRPGA